MDLWAVVAVLVVLSPMLAIGLASAARRVATDGVVSGLGVLGSILLLIHVSSKGSVEVFDGWFVVDRVAATWIVFALVVVLAVRTFAHRQLAGDPQRQRFHVTSAVAATTGVALFCAGDLLVLGVIAAASSVASAVMVGFRRDGVPVARRMVAILLGGDALLLIAVAIIALETSDTAPSALGQLDGLVVHVVAVLVVAACLARCAQIPFHGWLPRTLVAPTPVSALLHAGLVNAGGVILIRFSPLVSRSLAATLFGLTLATAGMVLAAAVMRSRSEVKSALVWSTTTQMGFMLVQVLVGVGPAAAVHLIAHGAYKSHLFLWSGSGIEHEPAAHETPRPVDHAIAFAAAVAIVAAAVALTGYDLSALGGAALLIPAFAAFTLHSVIVARLRMPSRAARATGVLIAGLFVATAAYLGIISMFKSWLNLPDAVPAGAWALAAAVVVTTVVGGALMSGSRFVPLGIALPVQALVLAVGRRPVLQAAALARNYGPIDQIPSIAHRSTDQLSAAS